LGAVTNQLRPRGPGFPNRRGRVSKREKKGRLRGGDKTNVVNEA